MTTRIAFQIALFLLPFLMFAIYRIATRNKRSVKEKWPFALLAGSGLALTLSFYVFMLLKNPYQGRQCNTPPRLENGKVIESETYPCEDASIDRREGGSS